LSLLTFSTACQTGIRREAFTGRNAQVFIDAKGHRATEYGMKPFHALYDIPDTAKLTELGESKAWPFPQIFYGKAVTLMCFADAIYSLDLSTSTYTLINTKDATDTTGTTSKAITSGYDWHFVDLYDCWMLFNVQCVVFKTKWSEHVFVQDSVSVFTGCAHKEGRVILGGFEPSNFASMVDWATFWETYASDRPEQAQLLDSAGADSNWVWWSSYFAPDMLHLFWQDILIHQSLSASDTGYSATDPFVLELEQMNQSGLRPLPWRGAITNAIPLGNGVAIYGDGGSSVLDPYADTYAVVTPVNMPQQMSLPIGSTRTCVAGDERRHILVSASGELWQIDNTYRAERLGYKAPISSLDLATLMVIHEPYHDEFYIGDGSGDAFLLNKNGLTRAPWMPSRVAGLGPGELYGAVFYLDDAASYVTEKFRGPSGSVETLSRILVVGMNSSTNGWEASIKYRLRPQDDFTQTDWYELDGEGGVDFGIPYLEAEIALRANDREAVTLEDIRVLTEPMNNPAMAHWIRAAAPGAATE